MADSKYGQIFTEDDVRSMVEAALATGHDYATLVASTDEFTFPPEEPVFVLRAKDELAIATLNHYRMLAINEGSPEKHVSGVDEAVHHFQNYATQFPDNMKLPD